jgi:hypothetical protein
MKTLPKIIALFTTASVPVAISLEAAGLDLPASLDVGSMFCLFVVSLVTLIALTDYSRAHEPRLVESLAENKAAHPLAA